MVVTPLNAGQRQAQKKNKKNKKKSALTKEEKLEWKRHDMNPGSNQRSVTLLIYFVFIQFIHGRCETRRNDTDQMMSPR